jgi:hypothetical protein
MTNNLRSTTFEAMAEVSGDTSVVGQAITPEPDSSFVIRHSSLTLVYVAYPSSLTLRSANAVQTYSTARELRTLDPRVAVLIPRWAQRESVFGTIGAHHLLRLPFNVLSHLWQTTAWSYLERSWLALRATIWLARRRGRGPTVIYVRDAICAAWFGAGLARLVGARLIYECHALEAWNPSRARSCDSSMRWRSAAPIGSSPSRRASAPGSIASA